jgi:hypothetical protein
MSFRLGICGVLYGVLLSPLPSDSAFASWAGGLIVVRWWKAECYGVVLWEMRAVETKTDVATLKCFDEFFVVVSMTPFEKAGVRNNFVVRVTICRLRRWRVLSEGFARKNAVGSSVPNQKRTSLQRRRFYQVVLLMR